MFIVDLLTALFAPIFIPIIEQFYSKTKKPAKVQGTKGNYIVTLSISEFVKQLPSAFIANTIWGLTYKTNIVSQATIAWMGIYSFLLIWSFIIIVYSHKKQPNILCLHIMLNVTGFILVVLSFIRVFDLVTF